MFATGIVFDTIGSILFVAGVGIAGAICSSGKDCGDSAVVWGPLLALGLVHLGIGIPLTVIGGRKELAPPTGWYVPRLRVGPRDAKAVWSFQF
jgi:hypothetical protein